MEQAFNSLHAQREACEAYIASQRSEGWVLIRDHYDDGGISGGTLERPGLQRLLEDIGEGLVDVVVVYKIDRLSRALMDFSKLVEVFDRNDVTFVFVTQSFNTNTSMELTGPRPCSSPKQRRLNSPAPPRCAGPRPERRLSGHAAHPAEEGLAARSLPALPSNRA